MKLDLNKPLVDLEGKEIKDSNMGKTVGNFLAGNKTELDAVKAYDIAGGLYSGKAIEIDDSDINKLEKSIEDTNVLTPLAKAQVLKAIRATKDAAKKGE